jgi:hypothetical protein
MSLSLDTWGSKASVVSTISRPLHNTTYFLNSRDGAHTSALVNLFTSYSSLSRSSSQFLKVIAIIMVVLILVVILFAAMDSMDEESSDAKAPPASPGMEVSFDPQRSKMFSNLAKKESPVSRSLDPHQEYAREKAMVSEADMPMDEVLQEVEYSDGSWARAYRDAVGERKEALELLFRCNIISTQEFVYSRVSQEHIAECVWIGTHMLRQKPLEEWEKLWQQAQHTFEDSVTACFTARTDARSAHYGHMPGLTTRSDVPVLDFKYQGLAPDDPEYPYTTRSSLHLSSELMSPPLMSPHTDFQDILNSPAAPGRDADRGQRDRMGSMGGEHSGSQRNLSPLILRCREIIAAPPQEGVPAQNPVIRNTSTATTVPASRQQSGLSPMNAWSDKTSTPPLPLREPSASQLSAADASLPPPQELIASGGALRVQFGAPLVENMSASSMMSPSVSPRTGVSLQTQEPDFVRIRTAVENQAGPAILLPPRAVLPPAPQQGVSFPPPPQDGGGPQDDVFLPPRGDLPPEVRSTQPRVPVPPINQQAFNAARSDSSPRVSLTAQQRIPALSPATSQGSVAGVRVPADFITGVDVAAASSQRYDPFETSRAQSSSAASQLPPVRIATLDAVASQSDASPSSMVRLAKESDPGRRQEFLLGGIPGTSQQNEHPRVPG